MRARFRNEAKLCVHLEAECQIGHHMPDPALSGAHMPRMRASPIDRAEKALLYRA
jgi:hypothetical protein